MACSRVTLGNSRQQLGEVERLTAGGRASLGELRDLLRWDIQEPGLRLLSVAIAGYTWIVLLDDFGNGVGPGTRTSGSVQDAGADALEKLDGFCEGLRADKSFEEVSAAISAVFAAASRLLASASWQSASPWRNTGWITREDSETRLPHR
jgi:hypothetical protein